MVNWRRRAWPMFKCLVRDWTLVRARCTLTIRSAITELTFMKRTSTSERQLGLGSEQTVKFQRRFALLRVFEYSEDRGEDWYSQHEHNNKFYAHHLAAP